MRERVKLQLLSVYHTLMFPRSRHVLKFRRHGYQVQAMRPWLDGYDDYNNTTLTLHTRHDGLKESTLSRVIAEIKLRK